MSTRSEDPAAGDERPIVVLVEWQAGEMEVEQAEQMARGALAVLADVPGLDDVRLFGEFETGVHCFLLTWSGREAMDRYMASSAMLGVRQAALPFLAGKPVRRVFVDYSRPTSSRRAL